MGSESKIPGSTARHAIVSDECRTNRTTEGAVEEALDRLRQDALACMNGWPVGKGAKFHFVLTVERPT